MTTGWLFFSHQISHFDKFWSAAKMNGFEAFVVDLDKNVDECVENNIHGRTEEEILKVLLWQILLILLMSKTCLIDNSLWLFTKSALEEVWFKIVFFFGITASPLVGGDPCTLYETGCYTIAIHTNNKYQWGTCACSYPSGGCPISLSLQTYISAFFLSLSVSVPFSVSLSLSLSFSVFLAVSLSLFPPYFSFLILSLSFFLRLTWILPNQSMIIKLTLLLKLPTTTRFIYVNT